RRERLLLVERRLDHLEDPGFVFHDHSARPLGHAAESIDLLRAPLRAEIARREYGNERRGLRELIHDFVGEDVVSLQFLVPPDPRISPFEPAQKLLKGFVKDGDPTVLPARQRLVVDVGVTDEDVAIEAQIALLLEGRTLTPRLMGGG